jgi:hypothetical protein
MKRLLQRHGVVLCPAAASGLLAVLKLAGVIGWSWVWILAPVWIAAGIYVVLVAVTLWALCGWGKQTLG